MRKGTLYYIGTHHKHIIIISLRSQSVYNNLPFYLNCLLSVIRNYNTNKCIIYYRCSCRSKAYTYAKQMIFFHINKKLLMMKLHYFVGIGGKNIYERFLRGCLLCIFYDLIVLKVSSFFVHVSNII